MAMAIKIGAQKVEIITNELTTFGGTDAVRLGCVTNDEERNPVDVVIWLTAKSAGIARASLKLCGFDVDSEDLSILVEKPDRFEGVVIPIVTEERDGFIRAQIALSPKPSSQRVVELQGFLRAVKKPDPVDVKPSDGLPF